MVTGRRQCPATSKRTGEQCKRFLAPGQKVCKWHGGAAPQALAAAVRRAELQRLTGELARLGVPLETDPGDALLAMVCEAAGNVAFLRGLVQRLRDPVTDPRPGDAPELLVERDDEAQPHGGSLRRDRRLANDTGLVAGTLYGRTKPDTYEAAPHVLVAMYNAERDRLANIAALALRAGVDERRVRLAEADADRVFSAVNGALAAAGLTPTQQEAFRLALAAALRSG